MDARLLPLDYARADLDTKPWPEKPRRFPAARAQLEKEIDAVRPARARSNDDVVRAEELAGLPPVVQRYLGFMRVVDKPRRRSIRAGFTGRFRLAPEAAWQPCEAWQEDARDEVMRAFYMQTTVAGLVPTFVRDTYLHGEARMLAKALDLFPVVDVRRPELDVAELVTYLNDAVLMAPSLLLVPGTEWRELSADTFEVRITNAGRSVSAQVQVEADGKPLDFCTEDRFGNDPYAPGKPFVRARWSTPVAAFTEHDGQPVLAEGSAVWHFPKGSFAYARLRLLPGSFAFDLR